MKLSKHTWLWLNCIAVLGLAEAGAASTLQSQLEKMGFFDWIGAPEASAVRVPT